MTRTVKGLGIVSFLLFATFPAHPLEGPAGGRAEEFIERALKAYGGWEQLSRVSSYRMEGTLRALIRNLEGGAVRIFERPDRLKVILSYPGTPEVRILNRDQGWRPNKEGTLVPVEGFLLSAMRLQAARAALPWILQERRDEVRFLQRLNRGTQELTALEISLAEGLTMRVYLEPEEGRIVRSEGFLSTPVMSTHFATEYSDFRRVEGVVFAFREENYASGRHTGSTRFRKIELNPALSENEFRP